MAEDDDADNSARDRQLELIKSNSGRIESAFDDIEFVFEEAFEKDKYEHNDYSDYSGTMRIMMRRHFDPSVADEISEAIINIIGSFNNEVKSEIEDESEQLAEKITRLVAEYQLDVQKRANIVGQGPDYWSNIKTEIGVRSSRPKHSHEFIRAHDNRVEIDSSVNGTLLLAEHLLNQVDATTEVIGEDTLHYLDNEVIENILEVASEIQDDLEQYDGSIEPEILDAQSDNGVTDEDDTE